MIGHMVFFLMEKKKKRGCDRSDKHYDKGNKVIKSWKCTHLNGEKGEEISYGRETNRIIGKSVYAVREERRRMDRKKDSGCFCFRPNVVAIC